MKKKIKTVFVILVYRNTKVLIDFFDSFHVANSQTIVVNSYFDDNSLWETKKIAEKNGADFINIPNKGYGFGNNIGTEFAIENYDFDFLIISNSDIIINDIGYLNRLDDRPAVYAPCVKMKTGKNQNPNIPWYVPLFFKYMKRWVETKNRFELKKAYIISRGTRELFLWWTKISRKDLYDIFSPHGSFLIFSKKAVDELYPIFNDKMFLYFEEHYLGLKCKLNNIPVYYCPQIDILHLEGASSENVSNKFCIDSMEILLKWMQENSFKL